MTQRIHVTNREKSGQSDMNPQLIRELELHRQRPVSLLFLPGRVQNSLLRHGIRTVGQLITRSEEDLLTEVRGLGATSTAAIVIALAREGLNLAADSGYTRYPRRDGRHVVNHHAWLDSGSGS